MAERPSPGGKPETAAVSEGSLVSCAAYLSSTRTSIAVRAAEVRRCLLRGFVCITPLLKASTLRTSHSHVARCTLRCRRKRHGGMNLQVSVLIPVLTSSDTQSTDADGPLWLLIFQLMC